MYLTKVHDTLHVPLFF